VRAKLLEPYPWLLHAFTTRRSGNLSYDAGDGTPEGEVERNRRRLLDTLLKSHPRRLRLVTLDQIHSAIVRVVDARLPPRREPDGAVQLTGDAVITNRPGLLLAVQAADCLPILLVDPVRRVVANVHAGWRGTLARIAEKTIGRMRMRFGAEPSQMLAAIGPGIQECCYEVGREMYERYLARFADGETLFRRVEPSPSEVHWHPKVTGRPLKPAARDHRRDARATSGATADAVRWFLNLVEANRRQLRLAGLRARNIAIVGACTACHTDLYFSYRAEAGRTGRQMGVVGIALRR
jgi:YfiH family protein